MAMKIKKAPFGETKNGESVTKYTMCTDELTVSILDYGATIQSILVSGKDGKLVDVVLGHDSIAEYEKNDGYLGACIGRVGNRIGGAAFTLNGKLYSLYKNDGENHLHGGARGFDKYIWRAEELQDGIRFSRLSPDGEEGYPGNLSVSVTYQIKGKTLSLTYDAATDADTLCNLTNHSYFNLNGGGSVLSHMLLIHADSFLENDAGCLPTGKILNVEGTPFDFRQTKEVGRDIGANNVQLHNCGGYDHNFCLNDTDAGLRPVAQLSSAMTGIMMRVATTMPGMQVYSANFLTERDGKNRQVYKKHDAICLETQFYPNAINCENFRKPILHTGESYHHVTTFSFSTGDET